MKRAFAGPFAVLAAALSLLSLPGSALAEDIKLRIASGHPVVQTYVNLMSTYFVPEVTKRVAARTPHKVEFIEAYGGSIVKVADVLEGVQSGIIDLGGYNFGFEPSNLPLHAFQVMLPFGTMSPVMSLKIARSVFDKVPYMSKVLEDKFNQRLIALIADNGYNLGTNFDWNTVARQWICGTNEASTSARLSVAPTNSQPCGSSTLRTARRISTLACGSK